MTFKQAIGNFRELFVKEKASSKSFTEKELDRLVLEAYTNFISTGVASVEIKPEYKLTVTDINYINDNFWNKA